MSSPSPDLPNSSEYLHQHPSDNELTHPSQKCQCNEKLDEIIETFKTEPPHLHCPLRTTNHHHSSHALNAPSHSHPVNQLSQINQISCSTHNIQSIQSSPKINPATKLSKTGCSCHLPEDEHGKEETERRDVRKFEPDDRIEISPLPPALPPRPPPRPRFDSSLGSRYRTRRASANSGESKKYVFCCTVCGGLVTILGSLFLTVYFLLRSLTSTLNYFETIPTFVPASMLIFTGILIMILSKRKYRNNYLIKVGGLCCLICALVCVLVTITTTVIHMNRLQTLRECVYTKKTRTCTCYSVLLEAQSQADEGMRFVFDSTPDCEVIHGELYVCLRMMFGISVTGILVCIFSCMLMYQLLSHEKKKMYWEQLEMRCRSFYQQHNNPPGSAHGSVREPTIASTIYCSCCEECRYPPLPVGPQVYPWDTHNSTDRFWTPGRIGNFYSPNPGDVPPGENQVRSRGGNGWSWRRFPWGRNSGGQTEVPRDSSFMYQGVASSADSQYGFTTRAGNDGGLPRDPISGSSDSYSMLDNRPPMGGVYVWGPPPPYSNPNSPARRIFHSPAHRYQHLHHHPMHGHESHCQMSSENPTRNSRRNRPYPSNKQNYENTTETEIHHNNDNSESTDTSSCLERISHTLPVRKMKKRTDMASVKSIYHQGSSSKVNVQNIFMQNGQEGPKTSMEEHSYTEPNLNDTDKPKAEPQKCRFLPRLQGVENPTFQKQENSPQKAEAAESEVYFADVSSCCNISVRNDGQDSSLYDEALENQKPRIDNNQCLQNFQENVSNTSVNEDEDYLVHRMGSRQMSVRSRMPIPLPENDDMSFPNENCLQLLTKDISQNSLCSSVQTPLTETTDDAVTPSECCASYFTEPVLDSPKNRKFSSADQYLAPDAQYEIVQNQEEFRQNSSNLTNTISGLNNFGQNYYNQSKKFNYLSPSGASSKSGGVSVSCRKNTGCNITNLIQNLGVNSGGLLYGEASAGEEETLGQSCHSDGTMDSGWQSGSEKLGEAKKVEEHSNQ
ncbi:hypothetical protein WA026_017573 [Henosepilachna vigintioctopunctata]|uniref:Uncharacterized protein n=1 Tax=Henosepilachna vigintioctopunctata TaxID=420089 RepID=A0AAW1V2Z2_9CUCU